MGGRWSRREFVRQSTLAGVGVALSQAASRAQEAPIKQTPIQEKLNLGIIGVATAHLEPGQLPLAFGGGGQDWRLRVTEVVWSDTTDSESGATRRASAAR